MSTDESESSARAYAAFRPSGLRQWSLSYSCALLGLALVWALENFIIQASAFDKPPTTIHPISFQSARFCLDFLAATGVLIIFSRAWLIAILTGDFILSAIVLPYSQYFHHTLSLEATLNNVDEGMQVSSFGMEVVPIAIWLILAGLLAVKIFWIFKITPQPAAWRWRGAAVCLTAGAACVAALQFTSFRLPSLRTRSPARAVYAYGYLNTWGAELVYGPNMKEIARELNTLHSVSPDRLIGVEKPWAIPHDVAVVQMESIGWEVLNYRIDGQLVAPFLSGLARSDRCFKVQAYHSVGSADMDYAVLSDGTPTTHLISYDVPGLTYSNGLPAFMQEHGYHTAAFHGNDGGFFNRRANFERMSLDEIWFKEDFKNMHVKQSRWGVRDAELFKLSADTMRESSMPQFHFIITLDSHGPFDLIDDEEKQIFPHSENLEENYFNSARLLDDLLSNYVATLPHGTLVILYGDHPAGVSYEDFHPARDGAAEFVPCIVHVCGEPAPAPAQASFTHSAPLPRDLRIIDVVNFLRHQIDGTTPGAEPEKTNLVNSAVSVSQTF